eukprot:104526-Alexandrium_andersonii.AAC.1
MQGSSAVHASRGCGLLGLRLGGRGWASAVLSWVGLGFHIYPFAEFGDELAVLIWGPQSPAPRPP